MHSVSDGIHARDALAVQEDCQENVIFSRDSSEEFNWGDDDPMKMPYAALASALAIAGCASTSMPGGLKSGEFVNFACEGGKRYSARASTDAKTVRLRYEGGWELDRKADGIYESDGWKLSTTGTAGSEVTHNGKVVLKGCKPD